MTEPYTCTAEVPWTKEMGDPEGSQHPDAEEVIYHDCFCCQHYRCPNCRLEWKSTVGRQGPCQRIGMPLLWEDKEHGPEAIMGDFADDDGLRFSIMDMPTNHRRGRYRLLVEVADRHQEWGCFDEQDQPMRYFHDLDRLKGEADAIAFAIAKDHERKVNGPLPGDPKRWGDS